MKIDKNTGNAYACYEKIQQIILCILCKNYTPFYKHSMGSHLKEHSKVSL